MITKFLLSIDTVPEASEMVVAFDGNERDHLDHGEIVHLFATNGDRRSQVNVIGAGDLPSEGPPHVGAIQRMHKLR